MRGARLGNSGLAAVEFGLIAPVLILMMMGLVEETELLRAQMKLSHAAGLLAKMAAQQTATQTPGPNGTLGNLCSGAGLAMIPLPNATLAAAIASVTTSANGSGTTTAMDWESDTACATAAAPLGATKAVGLATGTGLVPDAGDSLIIVRVTYAYAAATHVVLSASYPLSQVVFARPRTNATIACPFC